MRPGNVNRCLVIGLLTFAGLAIGLSVAVAATHRRERDDDTEDGYYPLAAVR